MFYKLEEHTPVECKDGQEWAEWFEKAGSSRIVAQDDIGDYLVSTVFLAVDHNPFDHGPPLLFETMVFENGIENGKDAGMTTRYSTWSEAAAGHRRMVLRVRNTGRPT